MTFRRLILFILIVSEIFSVASAQTTFLTNGLVAYYSFNGNVNDLSGNHKNGVINGSGITFTADRDGLTNAALHFTGSGGYVSITPTPFNINADYSICFWIKLDGSGNPVNN